MPSISQVHYEVDGAKYTYVVFFYVDFVNASGFIYVLRDYDQWYLWYGFFCMHPRI